MVKTTTHIYIYVCVIVESYGILTKQWTIITFFIGKLSISK
jgi:hypothetical protein